MWDTKYRPLIFDDVLGQHGATQVLRARLRDGKAFDTSYIFAGGHGCGKTTMARILARAMLCQTPDSEGNPCNSCGHCRSCLDETFEAFTELDAASHGTTADMRDIVEGLAFAIPGVEKRIYLLDEAHRMSRDGQDVLLKSIEDKRVVVIFCTTELPKIRDTIKSRCEVHEIKKISREDILSRMEHVLQSEGVKYEKDAVLAVIDLAKGHVRDTLNKLETVAQLGPVTMTAVEERLDLSVVSSYYSILLSLGNPAQAIPLVEAACDRVGPSSVASGLAEAAMNSYRSAHKILAEYSYLDREAAAKVYETFREDLPKLADYFLRLGYVTRLHLVCDVVRLCGSGGIPMAQAEVSGAPVVVQVSSPATSLIQSPTIPPTQSPTIPPTRSSPTEPAPASTPQPLSVDPVREKDRRLDGIGPVGSSDPYALGSFDHLAVPAEKPRDSKRDDFKPKMRRSGVSGQPLTPQQVRVQLLEILRPKGSNP